MFHSIEEDLSEVRRALLTHALYGEVVNLPRIRKFMEYHVFAVWDFMSLLKSLQTALTCTTVPWLPVPHREAARLINEIVVGEESDEDGRGGYERHFELYREAMEECGADTHAVDDLISQLRTGTPFDQILPHLSLPPAVKEFLEFDQNLVQNRPLHCIAAAFFYGREDIIPEMFRPLVQTLSREGEPVSRLLYYLNRHIEIDEGMHGPRARRMLEVLCGNQTEQIQEADQTALEALRMRSRLWDAAYQAVRSVPPT